MMFLLSTPQDHREEGTAGVEPKSEAKWSALRDNYMIGAKMKDWDKEESGEEGPGPGDPDISDSD